MPQILNGLKKNEFIFLLQPQYELNTRKIIGAEALVRWNHPALGEISPAVFIPVLENNGYITKLDQKIWEDVCAMIRRWIDEGIKPLAISINVTKTDLLAMDVVEIFDELLKKYRIPPKYLNIDIAENAYKEVYGIVSEVEKSLQQKGFRIALDGFDGDYMGLHSVGEIGADVLKLDLRSLNKEKKSGSVQDVFDRAKTLRLTLTAEGIESMEQLSLLRKCGCTEGQGYVFSRPLSIEEFENPKGRTGCMRRRRKDQNGEYNYWQPATDMMTGLVFVLMLIVALLGLYLLSDYTGYKYDETEGVEETTAQETRPDDDGWSWKEYKGNGDHEDVGDGAGDGGGSGQEQPIIQTGGGGYGDEGIKSAVFTELVDDETDRIIPDEGVRFELYRTDWGLQNGMGALQILNTYYPEKISYREYETTEEGVFYLPEKSTRRLFLPGIK